MLHHLVECFAFVFILLWKSNIYQLHMPLITLFSHQRAEGFCCGWTKLTLFFYESVVNDIFALIHRAQLLWSSKLSIFYSFYNIRLPRPNWMVWLFLNIIKEFESKSEQTCVACNNFVKRYEYAQHFGNRYELPFTF